MASTGLTVVTGASGHIGNNLVRALLAQGRRLRVVVRDDQRAIEGLEAERVRADLREPESLRRAFTGAEVVYHLAGRISITGDEGGLVHQTNVLGTRNVVEAAMACGVRRLVHFSSIHALSQAPVDEALDETRPPVRGNGCPAYDRSKAGGEEEVQRGVERGLDAVIVNPTSVLGPHDYKPSAMGEVLVGLARRRFVALVAGGFDWVDVRDVVGGAMAAEERGKRGERYLLSGHWHPVVEIARLVEEVTGVKAPCFAAPFWLAHLGVPFVTLCSKLTRTRALYTRESLHALAGNHQISHAKATRDLAYAPRPLRETVEDFFRWHRERGEA